MKKKKSCLEGSQGGGGSDSHIGHYSIFGDPMMSVLMSSFKPGCGASNQSVVPRQTSPRLWDWSHCTISVLGSVLRGSTGLGSGPSMHLIPQGRRTKGIIKHPGKPCSTREKDWAEQQWEVLDSEAARGGLSRSQTRQPMIRIISEFWGSIREQKLDSESSDKNASRDVLIIQC